MTAKLKPYPEMLNSGVEWLGKVPAHWEVRRLRNIAELRASNVDKHSKEGEIPIRLCNYVDVYKNDHIRSGMAFMAATAKAEEVNRFRLCVGDVLITKDSETWNDIGVPALVQQVDANVVCGYHLALLRPIAHQLNGSFLFRALQSQGVAHQFHMEAKGVTRYGLSHDAMKSVQIPVPPFLEQTAIARFLNHADRRIQRYIRAKQKLIALLEEQKQIIIHEAVTGQLDVRTGKPYPEYKKSGVKHFGKVPKFWRLVPLKRVLARLVDCVHKTAPKLDASDYFVIRTTAVRKGKLIWDGTYCTDKDSFDEWTRRCVPRDGDVIFTREAPAGEACLVPTGRRVCLGQRTVLLRPDHERCDPSFLVHMIYAGPPKFHIELASQGSTVGHFNVDDIGSMPVLLPTMDEQKQIVDMLALKSSKFEEAGKRINRELSLLRKFRTRLIADVVTGKLDVREAAAELPDTNVTGWEDGVDTIQADSYSHRAEHSDAEEVNA